MGFNYAKEKRKFDKYWETVRQQYKAAGMCEYAIKKIYDFDWEWFKSRRRYINHLADLPDGVTVEDFPQEDVDQSIGDTPQHYGYSCVESTNRFYWLDEIENDRLLQKLLRLSSEDLELLTVLVFEGYTQSETAQQKAQNQQSISRHFQQIRKFLEKSV